MTLSPTRLMEISKNIQEARLKQRKTTEDMADCIGISARTLLQGLFGIIPTYDLQAK